MQVRVIVDAATTAAADLLAVGVFEGGELCGATAAVDAALSGAIAEIIATGDFRGKVGDTALWYARGAIAAKRVLIVGLGKQGAFTLDGTRKAAAAAARAAQALGVGDITVALDAADGMAFSPMAQAIVEGAALGTYRYKARRAKVDEDATDITSLTLLVADDGAAADAKQGADAGAIVAESVVLARDLANEPGNYMTPTLLAEAAADMATRVGLQIRVLDEAQMADLGMGALLGVAQGSDEHAMFIVLEHNAARATELDTYVVVGKGITFDSGGISIKGSAGMEAMKYDMSGVAATCGILRAAAMLDLPLHVVGLIPATENLPDGRAYKPGDVLTSMSGLTIEVISTDAEGRLILADALHYAKRYEPKGVVDLATLTGGVSVALGNVAMGVLGTDADLVTALKQASEATGEKVWELPLFDEYADQIKSDYADIKNSGGRQASTITGGMFLKRFAEGYPWAHLDIAGTAWSDDAKGIKPRGATGVGVRLLVQWLRDIAG